MIKAIFCDFYGTVVQENGPILNEVVKRLFLSGKAGSPEEIIGYWWGSFRKRLETANGSAFRSQTELALENFQDTVQHFQSSESPDALLDRMKEHWSNPLVYEDAGPFLKSLSLPVYYVTNSDNSYIQQAVKKMTVQPAGVFTSEQARYSKPRKELFLHALKQTGCRPEEVIHVGDSLSGDVETPLSIGIHAVWLNRDNRPVPDGIVSAENLDQCREIIERWSVEWSQNSSTSIM